ncbi:HEAT repeat domain-containing protein [Amycolatopsis sp. FBCC-B4732]|uniref:HEAT repeat domain-containing protein n=1 Tax=Amycolatopsis sp. FBCC-B4732 TaxID=3079339 RepID=UPI001FF5A830|nr:HEAT repeat domain-containing protein [Amycolatopsis sp. FBCC-B4732]UOX86410.1 HEAT repeat domain-containing protein [Amycolatopsis sp. FBCC-B4732]
MFDLDQLTTGDVRRWVEFDESVRRTRWPAGRRRPPRQALVLAACSRDGYVREAAVRRLAVSPDPEALPLLLVRCVDWVRPVRAAARAAALSKLDESALRAVLPLIGVLRRRQVDDWMTTLFRDNLAAALDVALALDDLESRRWAHAEALGLLPRERLLGSARRDRDLVVRTLCGTALLDRGEFVEELLAAGSPKVRTRALTLVDRATVEAHLADRSSAVRSMAQFLVREAGGDPARCYRALPVSPAAIAGLGETGTAADAARLEQVLTDDRPRIRALAVRGLRRIAPDSAAVRPLLTDPSPAVLRQVVAFLRGKPVEVAVLRELLGEDRPLPTRRAAASLLRAGDTWLRLHTDLALLRDDDLAADARRDLAAWLSQSAGIYTAPPPELAAAIEGLLTRLPAETAQRIRFTLPR